MVRSFQGRAEEKEGIFMAGLQITPASPGISTPAAFTTRTVNTPESMTTNADKVTTNTNEIRTEDRTQETPVDRAVADRREKERTESDRETEKQRTREDLENVVSVSEDGDTVQVSEDGATELEESASGAVVSRTDAEEKASIREEEDIEIEPVEAPEIEPIEAPEITPIENNTGDDKRQINSFVGYTDQQVEQMYLEGEISQNDYNTEIARREEIEEARKAEGDKFSSDMSRLEEIDSRTERADIAIDMAVKSGNEDIGIKERLDAVDSAFNERQDAARRQEEAGRLWDIQLRA